MPIKPENRDKYPPDWEDIRERILERDERRCKFCRAPNHTLIVRLGGTGVWGPAPIALGPLRRALHASRNEDATWNTDRLRSVISTTTLLQAAELVDQCTAWHDETGQPRSTAAVLMSPARWQPFITEVVLTIAHLDNELVDHSDENLAALCQRCHLLHDQRMRKEAGQKDQIVLL